MSASKTEVAEVASPIERSVRIPRHLGAGWHFTRHLAEMVVAMLAGMALLDVVIGALGEPPGYANPLVEYGLMGAAMALPMVGWMRFRGHTWGDGLEMTAAMILPMLALALPAALGLAGPTGHSLMILSHAAMIVGMVALMLFRWDRYTHGGRGHRA